MVSNSKIRIILVNPSHPGNIGATARAMKTMGLDSLYLVNPKTFPHATATALAAGADDILEQAKICSSLLEALEEIKIVFATSARNRARKLPTLNPRQAANIIQPAIKINQQIGILFGRENNGLTNDELELAHHQIQIPTNPDFSSLNIAAAVQLISYEIKMAEEGNPSPIVLDKLPTISELHFFYDHLQTTLTKINFLNPNNQKRIMAKLKLIFNRAKLTAAETSLLRGVLTTINQTDKSE